MTESRRSDVALGSVLLAAGAVAIADREALAAGVFHLVIGAWLLVVGLLLLARGVWFVRPWTARWRLRDLLVVAAAVVAVDVAGAAGYTSELALRFGPTEIAALAMLKLAVAIALARTSRLRAAGMALIGLLLATVGIDSVTASRV